MLSSDRPETPATRRGGGSGVSGGTSTNNVLSASDAAPLDEEEDVSYWKETKAIIGGVLGFWGGVGSLGTVFLVVVVSQRYCCRKDDDEKDGEG